MLTSSSLADQQGLLTSSDWALDDSAPGLGLSMINAPLMFRIFVRKSTTDLGTEPSPECPASMGHRHSSWAWLVNDKTGWIDSDSVGLPQSLNIYIYILLIYIYEGCTHGQVADEGCTHVSHQTLRCQSVVRTQVVCMSSKSAVCQSALYHPSCVHVIQFSCMLVSPKSVLAFVSAVACFCSSWSLIRWLDALMTMKVGALVLCVWKMIFRIQPELHRNVACQWLGSINLWTERRIHCIYNLQLTIIRSKAQNS